MSKYAIEVKQLFEPFIYKTTEGIVQIYKTHKHKCPQNTIDVLQWGDVQWTSMEEMFQFCDKITTFSATDTPDLSQCTDMKRMFQYAYFFNQDIENWDVSSVTDMSLMFYYANSFNQDIGNWDVSSVTDMSSMFRGADAFNQDIRNWNVSNVRNMSCMFYFANSFNQNISNWDVSNVRDRTYMFKYCPIQKTFKPRFKY